jgi:hypothetical protein
MHCVNVCTGTVEVESSASSRTDRQWDIIVVGLQEVEMSATAMVKGDTPAGRAWTETLRRVLAPHNFELAGTSQLASSVLFPAANA